MKHGFLRSIDLSPQRLLVVTTEKTCWWRRPEPERHIRAPRLNIVQTEKVHEIPFTGAATSDTGWAKRWLMVLRQERRLHRN